MPWVLAPFVPGFLDDPAKYDLTVLLTRICFPYLMCMSLMAAYAAILNGLGRFTAAAFAPILLNIVMIAFMAPLVLWPNTDVQTAIWIAVGTIAGGIAQLALVYAAIRRAGFVPKLQLAAIRRRSAPLLGARHSGGDRRRHHPGQHLRRHHHRLVAPTAPSPISITPTGSTSCRSASSASPSARCCCPSCRAI